jgi:hypothetical protein
MLTVEDEPIVALDLCLRPMETGDTVVGGIASGLEVGIHVEVRGYSPATGPTPSTGQFR